MRVRMQRNGYSQFVANMTVPDRGGAKVHPRLCAGATTRLFKLTPGTKQCTIVFTKKQPQCERFYEMSLKDNWLSDIKYVALKGFRGGFLVGVPPLLRQAYSRGFRYVRVQP